MRILILLILVTISISISAQERMSLEKFYVDKETFLIYTEVIQCDSLSKDQLINKTKNWAGISFNNLKQVITTESDDQLVIRYIDKSFYVKGIGKILMPWNLRLVLQFKDNKVKCSFYDGTNVESNLPFAAYHYKMHEEGLNAIYQNIIATTNSLKKSIQTKKEDW